MSSAITPASATRNIPDPGEVINFFAVSVGDIRPSGTSLTWATVGLAGEARDSALGRLGRVGQWAPAVVGRGEDEAVVVGHAVALRLGLQDAQEGPHNHPVELGVYAGAQLLPGLGEAHAGAAGLVQHHSGVGLRNREDLRLERDPGRPQLVRVAPPVEALVVPAHPARHLLELRDRRERLLAARRMLRQPALRYGVRLADRQKILGQPEKPDVV